MGDPGDAAGTPAGALGPAAPAAASAASADADAAGCTTTTTNSSSLLLTLPLELLVEIVLRGELTLADVAALAQTCRRLRGAAPALVQALPAARLVAAPAPPPELVSATAQGTPVLRRAMLSAAAGGRLQDMLWASCAACFTASPGMGRGGLLAGRVATRQLPGGGGLVSTTLGGTGLLLGGGQLQPVKALQATEVVGVCAPVVSRDHRLVLFGGHFGKIYVYQGKDCDTNRSGGSGGGGGADSDSGSAVALAAAAAAAAGGITTTAIGAASGALPPPMVLQSKPEYGPTVALEILADRQHVASVQNLSLGIHIFSLGGGGGGGKDGKSGEGGGAGEAGGGDGTAAAAAMVAAAAAAAAEADDADDLEAGGEGMWEQTLSGHSDVVEALAAHPTLPNVLVSASRDGTVRLWDVGSNSERSALATLDAGGPTSCLALSADGTWLYAGGPTPFCWPLDPAAGVAGVAAAAAGGRRALPLDGLALDSLTHHGSGGGGNSTAAAAAATAAAAAAKGKGFLSLGLTYDQRLLVGSRADGVIFVWRRLGLGPQQQQPPVLAARLLGAGGMPLLSLGPFRPELLLLPGAAAGPSATQHMVGLDVQGVLQVWGFSGGGGGGVGGGASASAATSSQAKSNS